MSSNESSLSSSPAAQSAIQVAPAPAPAAAAAQAPVQAPEQDRRTEVSGWGMTSGVVDLAAASTSLGAVRSGSAPAAVASGVLWAAGAGVGEVSNSAPRDYFQTAVNVASGVAGALGTVAGATTAATSQGFGYVSSAVWGLAGIGTMIQGARNYGQSAVGGGLQMLSGAANTTAAGLSMTAVAHAASGDDDQAQWYGTASSVAWGVGSLAAMGSAAFSPVAARQQSADPELGQALNGGGSGAVASSRSGSASRSHSGSFVQPLSGSGPGASSSDGSGPGSPLPSRPGSGAAVQSFQPLSAPGPGAGSSGGSGSSSPMLSRRGSGTAVQSFQPLSAPGPGVGSSGGSGSSSPRPPVSSSGGAAHPFGVPSSSHSDSPRSRSSSLSSL